MWSDGVCCIDWLCCAYAELFIILTSRAAQATVFRIFLFHFSYTSGYPGCGARDSWHAFIMRLLFSKSKRFEHLSAEKAAIKCCISGCHAMLTFCPWSKLLIMIFPSLPQTVEHGFPHQPSALGYSPFLRLMAIGTRSGAIKLYPLNTLGDSSLTSTELVQLWRLQTLKTSKIKLSMSLQARVTGTLKQFARLWIDFGLIRVGLSFQELSYNSNRSWTDADIKQDSALAMQKVRLDLA